jgi:DNA-binding LytR/AlgR family response regulator/signal transduction histidine kinase
MNDTLKYVIVEDDEIDRLSVETEADKFPFLKKIASCSHALEAVELISRYHPDVLFLDIEMPGMSGLQLAKMLTTREQLPVFITSHPEFAIESYEIEAFDYLLKPLTAGRFARCALRLRDFGELRTKAFAFEKEQESGVLLIKQGHEKCKLRWQDILYVEAMKDYTRIVLPGKQYLVLTTLSSMQEKLPPEKFVRIHRSYVVHRDKITRAKGTKIYVGDAELPVGKLYRNVLKNILLFFFAFLAAFLLAPGASNAQPASTQKATSPAGAQPATTPAASTPPSATQPSATPPSATQPDLAKIPAYQDKMTAWVAWCESLRLNASGNFVQLRAAGLKGLRLAQTDDFGDRSRFFNYTALGYYYESKFDSAQYYFYQSLHAAQQGHLTRQISRACVALIPVNFQLQQLDKVDSCKIILQSIVDTTRDRAVLQDGYYALGSYYQLKSYYSTAQDYFIRSIQLREKEVDTTADPKKKFDFAIQCDLLSKLYLNTQMTDKSLASLRRGERFASVSPTVANRLTSSFVEAFATSGHIDSALYYDRRLETNVGNPLLAPSEIVSSDLNIAIYYLDQHQYEKARPYISKADTLAAKIRSPLLNFQVEMTRGRWLEETGKYQPAIASLQQSLPVAQQLDKELYANDLKYMAQAVEGTGNAKSALEYYKQYVGVTDSLNKEKISRTFADLETHYQTNEKEQQISSLDKENRLHLLELENASRTRLVLILGLAALGIISLLLYFIYRNKEQLNRVLNERNDQLDHLNHDLAEANETKARLFGIISHDLRSPVSKIIRLLQLQKERPGLFTPEDRRRHEERLTKASENVLETMEDLLLWSKSQMAHFTPDLQPVKINNVLQKEISLLYEQLEEEEIKIVSHVPEAFSCVTDENFLAVILRNLLQNAAKHSEGNKVITVTANNHDLAISNPTSKVQAAAMNDQLHHRQVDSAGSGLGLQIAADLAARIDARLFFRGEDGVSLTAVLSWAQ